MQLVYDIVKKGFVTILNTRIHLYDFMINIEAVKKKLIALYERVKMYEVLKMLSAYSYIDF